MRIKSFDFVTHASKTKKKNGISLKKINVCKQDNMLVNINRRGDKYIFLSLLDRREKSRMKFILAVLTKLAQSKTNPALLQIFHIIYEYPSPPNRCSTRRTYRLLGRTKKILLMFEPHVTNYSKIPD